MVDGEIPRSSSLGTWGNIVFARSLMEDLQVPLKNSFIKSIVDGGNTLFWQEHWIENEKLCKVFPRLFRLEESPNATIKDRVSKSSNGLSTTWNWSRSPTGRTAGELDNLLEMLSAYSFNQSGSDVWKWSLSSKGEYTVKACSALLDQQVLGSAASNCGTLHNPLVPKKVEIFVWRVLKNRIPVRIELDKRGMDLHSVRCPLCDDALESVDHSLILCKHVRDIWTRVYKWWGVGNFSGVSLSSILDDSSPLASSSFGKMIWQALKWICTYLIWKYRNNKVF
ncbi:uncharacterized protein [Rutidosis leptorrhynchoides]|uniref:uncharacterized protein n=1 Tax=Rutidosis leptorrhynchoides TaxID=125765 RepID=UPI003A99271F